MDHSWNSIMYFVAKLDGVQYVVFDALLLVCRFGV